MKKYEELRSQFDQKIAELTKAIVDKDYEAINRIDGELKDIETEYRDELQLNIFGECRAAENPMLAAITRYSFETISHKLDREEKIITGVTAIYDKTVELDMVKFTKFAELSKLWTLTVDKLNQLMCLQVGKDLGATPDDIRAINEDFGFGDKAAKEIDLGKNPVSNTQLVKVLQSILDQLVFVDGTVPGKNKLQANNHDVAYLRYCYTSRGKRKELSVRTAKSKFVCQVMVDIAHRLITGKVYTVEFKLANKKDAADSGKVSAPESKPTKKDEPKSAKKTKKTPAKKAPLTIPAPTEGTEAEADTLPSMDEMPEV